MRQEQLGAPVMQWISRWLSKLSQVLFGLAAFVMSTATPGMPAMSILEDPDQTHNWTVFLLVAVLCGIAAGFSRKFPWPLYAIAIIGWIAFSMWAPIVLAVYRGALHLTRRRDSVIFLAIAAAVVAVPVVLGSQINEISWGWVAAVFLVVLLVGTPYLLGLWVGARRLVVAALYDRAAQLEREQEQRSELARVDERARIAREMHDVVAHRVSLMVLHAGALEVNTTDEHTVTEAGIIRTTGREALAELRQVLGVLRAGESLREPPGVRSADPALLAPMPGLSDLDELVERTRAAGHPVTMSAQGEQPELPLTVQRTAYRIVQEALTNVVKHAPGADTVVTLRYLPEAVEVKVENSPAQRPASSMPGSGLGLIGLRERVALLYGRFEARSRLDGGYTVSALLPTDARP